MGFDRNILANTSFQTRADGLRLFFPIGWPGKGDIIDTEHTYRRLFVHQKRWGLAMILLCVGLDAARYTWPVIHPSFLLLNVVKSFGTRRITKRLVHSDVRFSIKAFYDDNLTLPHASIAMLYFLFAAGIAAVALGGAIAGLMPEIWRQGTDMATMGAICNYLSVMELAKRRAAGRQTR